MMSKCKYANLNQMKNLIKMCRHIWHNISKFGGPLNAFLLFLRRENYVNVDILHRSLASKCDGRKLEEVDAFAWTWLSRISITLCSVIIHIGFITRALKSRWYYYYANKICNVASKLNIWVSKLYINLI